MAEEPTLQQLKQDYMKAVALIATVTAERDEAQEFVRRCAELGATDTDVVKHALDDQERIRHELTPLTLRAEHAEQQVAALRAALALIASHGDEENEWDAVDRYGRVRDMAEVALLPAPPQEPT